MKNEVESIPTIVLEDFPELMKEVTKELVPLLGKALSTEEQQAFNTFLGTLLVMALEMFDYLPPEQRGEILTNCGVWFDVGLLFGKSPKLLVEILNRVRPRTEPTEVPTWLINFLKKERRER